MISIAVQIVIINIFVEVSFMYGNNIINITEENNRILKTCLILVEICYIMAIKMLRK